jgi:hypothetical protein
MVFAHEWYWVCVGEVGRIPTGCLYPKFLTKKSYLSWCAKMFIYHPQVNTKRWIHTKPSTLGERRMGMGKEVKRMSEFKSKRLLRRANGHEVP